MTTTPSRKREAKNHIEIGREEKENMILTEKIESEIIKNIHTKMNGYKNQDIKKKWNEKF